MFISNLVNYFRFILEIARNLNTYVQILWQMFSSFKNKEYIIIHDPFGSKTTASKHKVMTRIM